MGTRTGLVTAAIVGALGSAMALACELVLPTVASNASGPDASEASSDTAPPSPDGPLSDAGGTCVHAEPPDASGVGDPGSTSFVVALQNVFLDPTSPFACNDAGATVTLGFDLDHTCTCQGQGPSCGASPGQCDSPGGRDVSGNMAILGNPLLAAQINTNLQLGHLGALIQVTGYNGQPDDRSVVAGLILTSGIAGDAAPQWNGKDAWYYDPGSYLDGSPLAAQQGYVTGRTLVLSVTPVTVNLGFATLTLDDALVVATVEPDIARGGYDLVGQIAGRVALRNALELLASFKVGGQYLCGEAGAPYRAQICAAADIEGDPTADNTGAACDALSLAIGFCASPARVGPPGSPLVRVIGCDGDIGSCGE